MSRENLPAHDVSPDFAGFTPNSAAIWAASASICASVTCGWGRTVSGATPPRAEPGWKPEPRLEPAEDDAADWADWEDWPEGASRGLPAGREPPATPAELPAAGFPDFPVAS